MAASWDKTQDSWLPSYLRNGADTLASQQRFAGQLEPQRQGFINQFLAANNPGNTEARIMRQGRINRGVAGEDATAQDAILRSQGLGTGYRGGNVARNFNGATTATNKFANDQYSPEGQGANLMQLLAGIGQGQSQPGLNPMLQAQNAWTNIWQSLMQQRQQDESKGGLFGQILGSTLGMAVPGLNLQHLFTPARNPNIDNYNGGSINQGVF